jgi:histidine triad (HIT) family protein
MPTLFSRIVAGEIPCHRVAENDKFLAFLDVFPLVEGHTLVIPKAEVDYFFDLDAATLAEINGFAQGVAGQIQRAIPCKRIGISVIGLEVPHAHMHLIPLNQVGDMNFERPKLQVTQEALAATAERIRTA